MKNTKNKDVKLTVFALRKFRKELKRRRLKAARKRHNARTGSQAAYNRSQYSPLRPTSWLTLTAPGEFSIITNRDEVVQYFIEVEHTVMTSKIAVNIDLSSVTFTDFPTVTMLKAFLRDGSWLTRATAGWVRLKSPQKGTDAYDLLKRNQFHEFITNTGNSDHGFILSRQGNKTNEQHQLDILGFSTAFFGPGSEKRLQFLSPILGEIFNNTNNHADPARTGGRMWYAALQEDQEGGKMLYCVVNLGIGMYDNLNRKGVKLLNSGGINMQKFNTLFGKSQSEFLGTNIPKGVRSSTGLLHRGNGLNDIWKMARKGPYREFVLITNKARVNFLDQKDIIKDAKVNFEGTIYYWEICLD